MTLISAVTLAVAIVGAVLGILNTWKAYDRDRPKLRVIPKHAIPVGAADPRLTFRIEVVNLSAFALTVNEVGVFYSGTGRRGAILQPVLHDDGSWPRRLEPRSSVTAYARADALSLPGHLIRCVRDDGLWAHI